MPGSDVAARGRRRGRAAQPRGDRAGAAGWGLTIRDGFGQTETSLQIGNSPGQPLRPGSMGRPMPGLRGHAGRPGHRRAGHEGEICLELGLAQRRSG